MATKVTTSKEQHFCSKTQQLETLCVKITTVTITLNSYEGPKTESHSRTNIQDCSGLASCGVQTTHASGATFDWDRCPVWQILRTL